MRERVAIGDGEEAVFQLGIAVFIRGGVSAPEQQGMEIQRVAVSPYDAPHRFAHTPGFLYSSGFVILIYVIFFISPIV